MRTEFTLRDWIDALDKGTTYVVPDEVKAEIQEAGTEFQRLCARHDVPCFLAYSAKITDTTVGVAHIEYMKDLDKVPLEILLMTMLATSGTKVACETGVDIIKFLDGEPLDD